MKQYIISLGEDTVKALFLEGIEGAMRVLLEEAVQAMVGRAAKPEFY
jgi:hypothetical protein